MRFVLALFGACLLGACEFGPAPVRSPSSGLAAQVDPAELPPSDAVYATAPTPGWSDGDAWSGVAERYTLATLRGRCSRTGTGSADDPRGDGRLALIARWAALRFARNALPDAMTVDAVARRVGYVGPPPFVFAFKGGFASEQAIDDELERQFATIPSNVVLTRYGVATITAGGERVTGIVVAAIELTLDALPKHASRSRPLHLTGKVADRFDAVRLSVTLPSGKVRSSGSARRAFDSDLTLSEAGVHRVELLGEGKSGPVVVANFPVYVDVDEPEEPACATQPEGNPALTPAQAETRLFELVNGARKAAGLAALSADADLATVARSHSRDMAESGFFGHVSPTTGDTTDRIRRVHFPMVRFGENVARARSADEAYAVLMASPGHRANMLEPAYSHVGVGASVRVEENGDPLLYVTCLFAQKRP
jgi:uncharacterized protein YkwD